MNGTLETTIGYDDAYVTVNWVATSDSDDGSTWWDINWEATSVYYNGVMVNPILDKPQWDKIEKAINEQLPKTTPHSYRPL